MTKPAETPKYTLRFISNGNNVTDGKDQVGIRVGKGPEKRVTVKEFVSSSKYNHFGSPEDRLGLITCRGKRTCRFTNKDLLFKVAGAEYQRNFGIGLYRGSKDAIHVKWASPRRVATSLKRIVKRAQKIIDESLIKSAMFHIKSFEQEKKEDEAIRARGALLGGVMFIIE